MRNQLEKGDECMVDGKEEKVYTIPGTFREVPYRCLVPLKVDNLLVAGRCFSADFMAQATVRLGLACLNMGQVAGTAAALSIKHNVTPRKLDPQILRARLAEMEFSLFKKPSYGVGFLSTEKKVSEEDLVFPKTSDDEGSAVGVKAHEKYARTGPDLEEEQVASWEHKLKQKGGYTNTGGDVGTYLE